MRLADGSVLTQELYIVRILIILIRANININALAATVWHNIGSEKTNPLDTEGH